MAETTVNLEELDPDELRRFRQFGERLFASARQLPETLWHYTSASGLIGILKSGTLYATQVRCLNDTSEYEYLAALLTEETRVRADRETDPWRKEMLIRTGRLMGGREVAAANAFVACLSAAPDDLGQWRGYGGEHQCAFAIELETAGLLKGQRSAVEIPC